MNLVPALNAVRDFNWHEPMTMNQAMGQALTLSTVITKAHWVFGAATLWGFYRLLKVPRLRWLLVSHVFLVFLYMLAAGSSGWLARELTGFWYNDAQRVAALIPMTAVPLAAVGITSAADALGRFVGRVSSDVFGRPLSSRRALGIACLAMMVVPAVVYPNQGIGQGAAVLQDRYTNLNFPNHMVTPDEQVLYEKLATQIPAGETVLGSPFTGAQFSAIWSGHAVVIPHTSSNPTPDVALVSQNFKSFTTDPQVCAALKRLKVGWSSTTSTGSGRPTNGSRTTRGWSTCIAPQVSRRSATGPALSSTAWGTARADRGRPTCQLRSGPTSAACPARRPGGTFGPMRSRSGRWQDHPTGGSSARSRESRGRRT